MSEEQDYPIDLETQRIGDMERVKQFLADPAVQRALAALNRKYFDEFKASQTPAEREGAWAKARVIDDLGIALQAVLDVGIVAKHNREREQQQHELQRKRDAERQRRSGR